MQTQFINAQVNAATNVYFEGLCLSNNLITADGSKKSIGVIFPSKLEFNTQAPEIMEIISGQCRVQLADTDEYMTYGAGEQFKVAGNSHFKIETLSLLNYICHFG